MLCNGTLRSVWEINNVQINWGEIGKCNCFMCLFLVVILYSFTELNWFVNKFNRKELTYEKDKKSIRLIGREIYSC